MTKGVKKKRIILWYTAVACLAVCLYAAIFLSPLYITLHTSSLRPYCYYIPILVISTVLFFSLFKGSRQPKDICLYAFSSVVCLAIAPILLHTAMFLDDGLNEYKISGFLFVSSQALSHLALLPAIISITRAVSVKPRFAGLWFAVAVICFVGPERIAPGFVKWYDRAHPPPGRVCSTNLKGLSQALQVYSSDYDGKFPTPSKWCDLLKFEYDVDGIRFMCASDPQGPCSYAMNESAPPVFDKSQEQGIVLLFESKPGWNQVGGPELFNSGNHEQEGGFVMFSNGMVRFVKTEEISKLKWKPDPSENKKAAFH